MRALSVRQERFFLRCCGKSGETCDEYPQKEVDLNGAPQSELDKVGGSPNHLSNSHSTHCRELDLLVNATEWLGGVEAERSETG